MERCDHCGKKIDKKGTDWVEFGFFGMEEIDPEETFLICRPCRDELNSELAAKGIRI